MGADAIHAERAQDDTRLRRLSSANIHDASSFYHAARAAYSASFTYLRSCLWPSLYYRRVKQIGRVSPAERYSAIILLLRHRHAAGRSCHSPAALSYIYILFKYRNLFLQHNSASLPT